MKICSVCNTQLPEDAVFCTNCGSRYTEPETVQTDAQPEPQQAPQPDFQQVPPQYNQYQPGPDAGYAPPQYAQQPYPYAPAYVPPKPWDHTAEYEAKDIAEHKLFAMLPYLFSIFGVIIALLGAKDSEYVAFHVRQALKLAICEALLAIVTAVLAITVIVPIVAAICVVVLVVIQVICFFQVCGGKAVEPVIIRSIGFLK